MGKVSRPLTILVTEELLGWPELRKLASQGHDVTTIKDIDVADLVLGPNCWLMTDRHRKYLPLAIKAARIRTYGKLKKGKDESEGENND